MGEQVPADTEMLEWLATVKCNSYTLAKNEDHAPSYQTARQWIEDHLDDFNPRDVPMEELKEMIATNTIWQLQIYEHTPVGFVRYLGSTLRSVVAKAMRDKIGLNNIIDFNP